MSDATAIRERGSGLAFASSRRVEEIGSYLGAVSAKEVVESEGRERIVNVGARSRGAGYGCDGARRSER